MASSRRTVPFTANSHTVQDWKLIGNLLTLPSRSGESLVLFLFQFCSPDSTHAVMLTEENMAELYEHCCKLAGSGESTEIEGPDKTDGEWDELNERERVVVAVITVVRELKTELCGIIRAEENGMNSLENIIAQFAQLMDNILKTN